MWGNSTHRLDRLDVVLSKVQILVTVEQGVLPMKAILECVTLKNGFTRPDV